MPPVSQVGECGGWRAQRALMMSAPRRKRRMDECVRAQPSSRRDAMSGVAPQHNADRVGCPAGVLKAALAKKRDTAPRKEGECLKGRT